MEKKVRALTQPFEEMSEFSKIRELLRKTDSPVSLNGCVDSQKMHMVYGLSDGFRNKIIVTFSDIRAKEIYEDYKFYDRNTVIYPAKDLIFYQADVHGNRLTMERMKVLRRILEGVPVTVVTTFSALMAHQTPISALRRGVVHIRKGGEAPEHELSGTLTAAGYEKVYQVEGPGQFAVRGGIVDIFDLTEENPYRIELWGDEVESIRSFDVLSQRSIETLASVSVYPATEMVLFEDRIREGVAALKKEGEQTERALRERFCTEEAHTIKTQVAEVTEQILEYRSLLNLESYIRYFYEDTTSFLGFFDKGSSLFVLDEPQRLREHADAVELEFRESMTHRAEKGYVLPRQMELLFSVETTAAALSAGHVVTLSAIGQKNDLFAGSNAAGNKFSITAKSIAPYHGSFETLVKDLRRYKKNGYRVLLLSGSRTRAKRLAKDLADQELAAFYSEDPERALSGGEIMTCYGHVLKGFEYPLLKYVILSESDIF
ncbi:MAG: transcription-repair coupling factor, partial [Lachnospiraceae bacterium]|nr:transcription-repair coupling factor [Lachnospiraceae bacterium]